MACNAQNTWQSGAYFQPWWRGLGDAGTSGNTANSSGIEEQNASATNGVIQPQDGGNGQEDQQQSSISTSMPPGLGQQVEPVPQMELVGHSIVAYPYPDPKYAAMLASYGQLPMAPPPQFLGMHNARMPLPLQSEEEPVYVNAKQYQGIMRRRQVRAKAELDKKVIKAKKPYLHESRHLHALRRARGAGGRFLNTKKLESNVVNPSSNAVTNFSNQAHNLSHHAEPPTNSTNMDVTGEMGPTVQDISDYDSSNGNSNSSGLSPIYRSPAFDNQERSCVIQQMKNLQMSGPSFEAHSMK